MAEILEFPRIDRPDIHTLLCQLVFRSAKVQREDGRDQVVNVVVTIEFARIDEFIDAVREVGGLWAGPDADGRAYFLPWPCACVDVLPLTDAEARTLA